jgi:glycosyltransferase involved in cell wall biosynthesis
VKVLVHSNAPFVSTGYGVQCRYLVERLHEAGHDVAVSSTYGLQGAVMPWSRRNIRVYPCGYEVNGNDIVHNHAMHHFEGDETGGWIIPLLDIWCLNPNPRLKDFNVAPWTPVDHFPVPRDVLGFFHKNPDAVPIAMSRYGERQLAEAGLDPVYIPLAVDTSVYKPTPSVTINGQTVTGRELLGMTDGGPIPDDAFLVGMVAMNKGWARDRKGFNEALRAFGQFWIKHQNAILYMHCDWPGGAEGVELKELAVHASVPEHAIRWVDQYAYRTGFTPEMMAAAYTAFDVLLAPSHGEGFCVPLIEAQACGTPVIASDFSAQPELVGAGWLCGGQLEWDPPQHASYLCPYTLEVIRCLEEAFQADRAGMVEKAVAKAQEYDADRVFAEHWVPFLATLDAVGPARPTVDPIPSGPGAVAVVVPVMKRPQNVRPLVESLVETTKDANIYFVCDPDDEAEIAAVAEMQDVSSAVHLVVSQRGHTYAVKSNVGYEQTDEPWVLICGDDVEFHPDWLDAAREVSARFDVVGTNDSLPGRVRNPKVASGSHADHFFVRRSYIDDVGACLDGPGVLAPEAYAHWFTDKEIIELAKARGVFAPCLDSIVEHHHPAYDGREDLREADPVYVQGQASALDDQKVFLSRVPLIQMQRASRGKR